MAADVSFLHVSESIRSGVPAPQFNRQLLRRSRWFAHADRFWRTWSANLSALFKFCKPAACHPLGCLLVSCNTNEEMHEDYEIEWMAAPAAE